MPTYNSEKYISDTINSILIQTYSNWELLITDDNSADNTICIIKNFMKNDRRIYLYNFKQNRGAGLARNNSIQKAKGSLIAFCDSDDKWKSHKLEKQIQFMLKNNLSFTYSSYDVIDENNNKLKTIISPEKLDFRKMLKNNYIGSLTAIYDNEKLGKIYMSKMRKRQDWVLWLNILKKIKTTHGILEPLAIYRQRDNSISQNKFSLLKYNWLVYKKEMGFGFIESILLTFIFILYYAKKKFR